MHQSECSYSRPHKTVTLKLGSSYEEIDEGLAPLIEQIWKAGIETMMSCQETEPGIAWIEFNSPEDLLRFLNIFRRFEPGAGTLYNRIRHVWVESMSKPEWRYKVNIQDMFDGKEEQEVDELACFYATIGIYFPQSDIPILLEQLKWENEFDENYHKHCG